MLPTLCFLQELAAVSFTKFPVAPWKAFSCDDNWAIPAAKQQITLAGVKKDCTLKGISASPCHPFTLRKFGGTFNSRVLALGLEAGGIESAIPFRKQLCF